MNLRRDDWAQRLSGYCWNMVRMDLPATFHEREHSFLTCAASPDVLALRTVFVLFQTAYKRLINFDRFPFAAHRFKVRSAQAFANTVHHEPARLRADTKQAANLQRAD